MPGRRGCIAITLAAIWGAASSTPALARHDLVPNGPTRSGPSVAADAQGRRLTMVVPDNNPGTTFEGNSADGAHVLVSTTGDLIPGPTDPHLKLYDAIAQRFLPTGGHVYYRALTPDGRALLFMTSERLTPQDDDDWDDLYLEMDGEMHLVSVGVAMPQIQFEFLADDGSTVIFGTRQAILPGDTDNAVDLYGWDAGTGVLTLVSPGVPVDVSFAGASRDGSRVFIQVMEDYAHVGSIDNLYEYVAGGLVRFGDGGLRFVSADGSRAYFITKNGYVPGDVDGTWDGYEWTAAGYRLMSQAATGWTELDAVNVAGDRWILGAQEALSPGDGNLTQDIYIGTTAGHELVSLGESNAYFDAANDDLSVVFYRTASSLVAEDTDGEEDVYRWDATKPNEPELISGGMPGLTNLWAIDPTGSTAIFDTTAKIDPLDTDGAVDIYAWTAGQITLLSPGSAEPVSFGGASMDTSRVFFNTQGRLVSADTNNYNDAYVSDLDTTPPVPTIELAVDGARATIDVGTVAKDGVWFDCRLDDGSWSECSDGATYEAVGPGEHTASVHAYDAAANKSASPATKSWTTPGGATDSTPPSGTISIAHGATFTAARPVEISVEGTDNASGVSEVSLSNDGVTWTTRPYSPTQAWTLIPGDGTKTVSAKWKDGSGNWSAASSDTIVLDATAPTSTGPGRSLVTGSALTSGSVPIKVAWSGSDAMSGVARYELEQSTDARAWTRVSDSLTAATLSRSLAPSHDYRFRVRTIDKAGNVGAWATGTSFRLSGYQEGTSAIRYGGTWTTSVSTVWWGGRARASSAAGATAKITVTGRSFAWLGLKATTRGKAKIYVNGIYKATVDLYSPSTLRQRLVWSVNWSSSATRTVTIKVVGTPGRPRIDVDAFLVIR